MIDVSCRIGVTEYDIVSNETKVPEFCNAVFVHQKIAGLDISVKHLAIMERSESVAYIGGDGVHIAGRERPTIIATLKGPLLAQLHDEMNRVVRLRTDNVMNLDNVSVFCLAKVHTLGRQVSLSSFPFCRILSRKCPVNFHCYWPMDRILAEMNFAEMTVAELYADFQR